MTLAYLCVPQFLNMAALYGCDTFVVLPPFTSNGDVIFGKNSDRPQGEVQEVVYYPQKTYNVGEQLQCTYIQIDQVQSTNAVLLSKPSWMWGAEMGANNHGVVIGNEAVWTTVDDDLLTERLLGMDLLRIGLERSSNSYEAVDVITSLIERYGQGGPCSDIDSGLLYHNSFLIADPNEAWVLETAGKLWAAEKIVKGYRNISNCLSIDKNITKMSNQLLSYVKENKMWSGDCEFSFKHAFSTGCCPREKAGDKLLTNLVKGNNFNLENMFDILRDKKSSICRPADDPFHTSGSWVSSLVSTNGKKPSCHWITATPDPSVSIFKPFIFTTTPKLSVYTISPQFPNDPAKSVPRFQFSVDRRHTLYKIHQTYHAKNTSSSIMKDVEKEIIQETLIKLNNLESGIQDLNSCNDILKKAVEKEILAIS